MNTSYALENQSPESLYIIIPDNIISNSLTNMQPIAYNISNRLHIILEVIT
jgi:hypothetical protein